MRVSAKTAVMHYDVLSATHFHQGIKKVKDIAAGSVLVAAIASLVIGAVVFLPKIILFIKSL